MGYHVCVEGPHLALDRDGELEEETLAMGQGDEIARRDLGKDGEDGKGQVSQLGNADVPDVSQIPS